MSKEVGAGGMFDIFLDSAIYCISAQAVHHLSSKSLSAKSKTNKT